MTRTKSGILAILGGSAAIFWPGALIFGYPGVMSPYWREVFQVGTGTTGNVMFFILAAVGIFMFAAGRWQEKVGAKLTVSIGAIICGSSLFIASYATNIYLVYLWAFLTGTGSCFVYITGLTVVQRWFVQRRGLASGIVNLFFGLSAAIMAPVFAGLLQTWGYVQMNTLIAVLTIVVGIIAAQFVQTPERANHAAKPSAGPEGGTQAGTRQPSSEGENAASNKPKTSVRLGESFTLKEAIRTKSFWFLWLTWALQGAAGIAMVTLSVAFGLAARLPMESAVLLLTAFNLTNGFSRLISGFASDILPRSLTLSLTFFAAAIAYFVLPHINNLGAMAILVAIIGFSFGTMFSVSAPLASDCFGLKHFGAIFGLVFTAYGFLSGFLGPSLSGYLLDLTGGSFLLVFTYLGTFCILSGFFITRVVPPARRSRKGSHA
jgi:OFA family oxalate/formate antiporter-like MFS transporter